MNDNITYTERQLNELFEAIFKGGISPSTLPEPLYIATLAILSDAVARGFGVIDITDEIEDLFLHFDRNIAVFSAAKTHQQVVDMSSKIFDSKGIKRSFSDFKKDAGKIFDEYNKNWLKTEYRTASNVSFGARQYLDLQADKDIAPLWKYVTAGDERVRQEHDELDGVVKHADDPFWDTYFPPNDWNCRCDVEAHDEDEETITENDNFTPPSTLFNFNPAKDKIIFDPNAHPYFNVADRYEVLKGNDFNLPLPDEV